MTSFAEVTTWSATGPVEWSGTVPPDWMQGRASFGGVPAAVGLRAIRAADEDGRKPRSVHVGFFGPVGGEPATVTAEILRRGRFVTHARAEIRQGTGVRTQVTATLADDRPSAVRVQAPPPPERPPAEGLVDMPTIPGVTPVFVAYFQMRWTDGSMPFSGAEEPGLAGWCRHATDPGEDPYAAILGLLDAWPPPVVPLLRGPSPTSSVSWSTIFHEVPDRFDPEQWWWFRSEAVAAGDGYAGMRAWLYDAQGRLAASAEQLVAVFDRPAQ